MLEQDPLLQPSHHVEKNNPNKKQKNTRDIKSLRIRLRIAPHRVSTTVA